MHHLQLVGPSRAVRSRSPVCAGSGDSGEKGTCPGCSCHRGRRDRAAASAATRVPPRTCPGAQLQVPNWLHGGDSAAFAPQPRAGAPHWWCLVRAAPGNSTLSIWEGD